MKSLLLLLIAAAAGVAQDGATRENWPSYGGSHYAWRYSALDQIHTRNISRLVPVWTFQTGDYENGLQATPIVVDGVLYLSTSRNWVFALNAATGKMLWEYRYSAPKEAPVYGMQNRGVAVGHGLVFMGTMDDYVVALDQKTGRQVWKVNVQDTRQCGCNITGAPLVVKDKVIIGGTGGDSAHRGYLNAFDAEVAKSSLDAAQIDSMIRADDAGGVQPGLWVGRGVELLVLAEDAQRADEVLGTTYPR